MCVFTYSGECSVDSARLVKVVAAFVSGVVVALGSALIYVRVSDIVHPTPSAETAIVPPEPPSAQLADMADESANQVGTIPRSVSQPERAEPVKKPTAAVEPRRQVVKVTPRREQPNRRIVQIAQNRPSSYPPLSSPPPAVTPVPSPAPAPAVDSPPLNENPQQPMPETVQPQSLPEQQSQDAGAPPHQPHVVTLSAGTSVIIRLAETLSTDHNYTGDTFRAALEAPIIMEGFIIAEKGSKVLGRIANAQRAGRVDGLADLVLTLAEINTTDGQRVRVDTTSYEKRGPVSSGRDTAEIAGGAALGALIGAAAGGG